MHAFENCTSFGSVSCARRSLLVCFKTGFPRISQKFWFKCRSSIMSKGSSRGSVILRHTSSEANWCKTSIFVFRADWVDNICRQRDSQVRPNIRIAFQLHETSTKASSSWNSWNGAQRRHGWPCVPWPQLWTTDSKSIPSSLHVAVFCNVFCVLSPWGVQIEEKAKSTDGILPFQGRRISSLASWAMRKFWRKLS